MPGFRQIVCCLAVVCAAVLAPLGGSAQEATPAPIKVRADLNVTRAFEARGMRPDGNGSLMFTAYVVPADGNASETLTQATAMLRRALDDSVGATLRPASVGSLGDEAKGFAGEAHVDVWTENVTVGLVTWRDGQIVYGAIGIGLASDPLSEVLAIAHTITGRTYDAAEPITLDPLTEMHTGGAWTLVPNLEDLPSGFSLMQESMTPRPDAAEKGTPEP